MNIIFGIIGFVVSIFIIYVLSIQFYKLGISIKDRFPIVYRLYLIFWCLLGSLVLITALSVSYFWLDSYMHERKEQRLSLIINQDQKQDILNRSQAAKESGFSDSDIFEAIKSSKKYSHIFNDAKKEGFSDQEIARYFNLYI